MNGIICINKATDYTSFDVVAIVRGMTKTKRVGHSGTLDPLATGVLPIFIGNATKACDMMPDDLKSYVAGFELGKKTDTLDITGTIIKTVESNVVKEQILEVIPKFTGEIEQIPPMYSAVKVNGQRLYDIARKGGEVERKPRKATIFELKLTKFDQTTQTGELEITCSKGTYVRTIIDDIGENLGVCGVMTSLIRTRANGFSLEECYTLEQAQELIQKGEFEEKLLPIEKVFWELPYINLNPHQSRMFKNGVKLDLNRVRYKASEKGLYQVYDNEKNFLAIAQTDLNKMELVIHKMFVRL